MACHFRKWSHLVPLGSWHWTMAHSDFNSYVATAMRSGNTLHRLSEHATGWRKNDSNRWTENTAVVPFGTVDAWGVVRMVSGSDQKEMVSCTCLERNWKGDLCWVTFCGKTLRESEGVLSVRSTQMKTFLRTSRMRFPGNEGYSSRLFRNHPWSPCLLHTKLTLFIRQHVEESLSA